MISSLTVGLSIMIILKIIRITIVRSVSLHFTILDCLYTESTVELSQLTVMHWVWAYSGQ